MALHNLARMTSATTGTGTLTLGTAVSGFLSFDDAGVANGEIVTYSIRDGAASEIGRGVYTTSGTTLTRATIYESTNSGNAINCSGSQEVFITAAAENLNIIDPYCIHHRADTPHADDDEFSTDTSGSYTAVTPTGTATWLLGTNHVASCIFYGQADADLACLLKAMTLGDGESFETTFSVLRYNQSWSMGGIVVTDGTSDTSNGLSAFVFISSTAPYIINVAIRTGTLTNHATNANNETMLASASVASKIRIRLKRNSSTSFQYLLSDDSGAQWYDFGLSGINPGFTPTHAGIFVSTFAGADESFTSFDYLRHVS